MLQCCYLENDDKTYQVYLEYIELLEQGKDSYYIDNILQIYEIKLFLACNGFDESNTNAMIDWIEKYSEAFRTFLNSVRTLVLNAKSYAKALNKDYRSLSRDEIASIEFIINNNKSLLEGLF